MEQRSVFSNTGFPVLQAGSPSVFESANQQHMVMVK